MRFVLLLLLLLVPVPALAYTLFPSCCRLSSNTCAPLKLDS